MSSLGVMRARVIEALERLSQKAFDGLLLALLAATHGLYLARGLRIILTHGEYGGSPSYGTIGRQFLTTGVFSWDGQHFTAFRPPLYPMFLALHQWLFPQGWLAASAVTQTLLSIATGFLVGRLAGRWSGDRLAVLIATLLYTTHLFYFNEVLSQIESSLFVFLVVCFFTAFVHRGATPAAMLALAMIAGLAHLTRPTGIFLLVVLAMPIARLAWRRGIRPAALAALLAVVGFVAVVAPWQLAIRRELGVTTLMSSSTGGENLYKGNNPDLLTMCPYVWLDSYEPWLQRVLRDHEAREDSEVDRDRVLRAAGRRYIRDHPVAFVKGLGVKLFALFSPRPTPLGKAVLEDVGGRVVLRDYRSIYTTFAKLMTLHAAVLLLGVVLFVVWKPARARRAVLRDRMAPGSRVILGAGLTFCLLLIGAQLLTIPYTRYRVPLDPLFAVAAGAAYAALLQRGVSIREEVRVSGERIASR